MTLLGFFFFFKERTMPKREIKFANKKVSDAMVELTYVY